MSPGQLPEGRYGRSRPTPHSRWTRGLVTLLGVLVGLAVAVIGYRNLGSVPVEGETLGFELLGDADRPANAVSLRFEVRRDEPDRPAVCLVRARSLDGQETGRKEVYVPPAPESAVEVRTVIQTSRPPVTADVYGCSLRVPPYLPSATDPPGQKSPGG